MSGIKNLKEKSKIQLDEMFDAKPVGKPGIQKDGKEEIKQTTQLDSQQGPVPGEFLGPVDPTWHVASIDANAVRASGRSTRHWHSIVAFRGCIRMPS